MATRHPRLTVFSGAFASLLVMSVLSAAMGKVVLGLIPAVSCFAIFAAEVASIQWDSSYPAFGFNSGILSLL